MVDSKRYDPTITRFQKHTKSFVSGKTKKGHLENEDREAGDVINEEGVLVRKIKKDIQGKGWEVEVDKKKYKCSYYGNSFLFLPNCTETDTYYIPKKECKVEISIDKKSKIYTITKIKGLKTSPNQQLISIIEGDKIDIKGGGKASVSVKQEKTAISGDGLEVEGIGCGEISCAEQVYVRRCECRPTAQPFLTGFTACVPRIGVIEIMMDILCQVYWSFAGKCLENV